MWAQPVLIRFPLASPPPGKGVCDSDFQGSAGQGPRIQSIPSTRGQTSRKQLEIILGELVNSYCSPLSRSSDLDSLCEMAVRPPILVISTWMLAQLVSIRNFKPPVKGRQTVHL